MRFFELNDGSLINMDHVVEIPSRGVIDDAEVKGLAVEIRLSPGYWKHIDFDDAIELRLLADDG